MKKKRKVKGLTQINVSMTLMAKEIHRRKVVPFAQGKSAIIYFLKDYIGKEVVVIPVEE